MKNRWNRETNHRETTDHRSLPFTIGNLFPFDMVLDNPGSKYASWIFLRVVFHDPRPCFRAINHDSSRFISSARSVACKANRRVSRRLLFGSFLSIDYTDLCILIKREDRTVKIEIESYSISRIEVRRFKKKIRIFVYNIERMRMEKWENLVIMNRNMGF